MPLVPARRKIQALLEWWMAGAEEFEILELRAFVVNHRQDTKVIVTAIIMPYSDGQAEGRVKRLELIKG